MSYLSHRLTLVGNCSSKNAEFGKLHAVRVKLGMHVGRKCSWKNLFYDILRKNDIMKNVITSSGFQNGPWLDPTKNRPALV